MSANQGQLTTLIELFTASQASCHAAASLRLESQVLRAESRHLIYLSRVERDLSARFKRFIGLALAGEAVPP